MSHIDGVPMTRTVRPLAAWSTAVFLFCSSSSAQSVASTPRTFGTSNTSWYRIGASEFAPVNGAAAPTMTFDGSTDFGARVYRGAWLFSSPHLPDGALLMMIGLVGCDRHDGRHIHWSGTATRNWNPTPLVTASTFDLGPGCGTMYADLSSLNYTVDNQVRQLLVRAMPDASDGTNQIGGAIIGYRLQVSPAPATPTFNDVPTDDPGFQFIKALAASGITGGCGGGNFCPDSAVTRRQMAIFLAKALGLSYPIR